MTASRHSTATDLSYGAAAVRCRANSTGARPSIAKTLSRGVSFRAITVQQRPNSCSASAGSTPRSAPRKAKLWSKAYIALGSNLGDRLRMIEEALQSMTAHASIRVLRTSLLYETAAMYVTEQDAFLNAVCEIETNLEPLTLLDALQEIENNMGRIKTIDKGPRNIDLDILLFEGRAVDTERLTVPHKLMHEREFVLRPLADLIPHKHMPGQPVAKSIASLLEDLKSGRDQLTPIVPFGPSNFLRPLEPSRRTRVMAILNVTPDSFSDGGKFIPDTTAPSSSTNNRDVMAQQDGQAPVDDIAALTHALSHVEHVSTMSSADLYRLRTALLAQSPYLLHLFRTITTHILSGATILDIGGQSTRPNATPISSSEEISRVAPAVLLCRLFFPSLALSLDTYRSEVADHFASRGLVHVINDVSAGTLDPKLLLVAARARSTVVLMHMRGDPSTMSDAENTAYHPGDGGVARAVAEELAHRVAAAEAAGIPRWRIVLDPGVGFAKVGTQNLELLERLGELRAREGPLAGLPWLVGSSRKKFLGAVLGEDDARVESEAGGMVDGLLVDSESEEGKNGAAGVGGGGAGVNLSEVLATIRRTVQESTLPDKPGEGAPQKRLRNVAKREAGTMASVTAAVCGGADVVRVHDVRSARDTVAVADAIWRRTS